MPEIENLQESAQHFFDIATWAGEIAEVDVALEAFELLTANNYDFFAAHALGVSL